MRITYDPEADVAYIYLNDGSDSTIAYSQEVGDEQRGVTADFDPDGQVLGIEVMGASRRFGLSGARSIQLEILSGQRSDPASVAVSQR
jgi:uncharacterized protein YuzE